MLRHVAGPRGRATHRAGGLEGIGGAHGARSGTGLVHVAVTRGGPAHRSAVPGRVLAVVAAAIALVAAARVAVGRARRPRRTLRVRRTAGARAGAVIVQVALARRGAADRARGLEGVHGAHGARAGAGLVHVAEAGGGAADRAGVPRRVLAVVAAAVALVEAARIAVVGARRPRRSLGVRRAAGARAGAILARITL